MLHSFIVLAFVKSNVAAFSNHCQDVLKTAPNSATNKLINLNLTVEFAWHWQMFIIIDQIKLKLFINIDYSFLPVTLSDSMHLTLVL